jgi:BirA family biotin operon repressor/biotin-[acetyl-CoA-carboxylase] ligase
VSDIETGVVLMLKSSSRYLTRDEISARVGVPAAEVAGAVDELRSRGYRIDEVPGHGYRLVDVPGVLDGCELRTAVGNRIIGREIFPFGQVGSTNDVAFSLARSGSPEGTLVIAEEQTRGKGRLGRVWHSPPGLGLWFSIVLRPGVAVYHLPTVSLAVALAVAGVARDEYGVDARIKWPNDVLVRSRKLCGILTEAEFGEAGVEFIVVGVGMNVLHKESDFPDELRAIATSISIETSVDVDRVDAISCVLRAVEDRYVELCRGGFEGIRLDILPLSSLIGKLTRVETANGIVEGVAVDIDRTGALVLRKENGLNERVLAGDATLIQPGGPP